MPALAGFPERLEAARHAMACQRHRVSTATGLPSQRYATLMHGGGRKHFAKLAALLAVRIEWLTTGAFPPEWYRYRPEAQRFTAARNHAQVGVETASQQ